MLEFSEKWLFSQWFFSFHAKMLRSKPCYLTFGSSWPWTRWRPATKVGPFFENLSTLISRVTFHPQWKPFARYFQDILCIYIYIVVSYFTAFITWIQGPIFFFFSDVMVAGCQLKRFTQNQTDPREKNNNNSGPKKTQRSQSLGFFCVKKKQ